MKTGRWKCYASMVGRAVPRPTRNSSRVAVSVTLVGNKFHSLMVLWKKEFSYSGKCYGQIEQLVFAFSLVCLLSVDDGSNIDEK